MALLLKHMDRDRELARETERSLRVDGLILSAMRHFDPVRAVPHGGKLLKKIVICQIPHHSLCHLNAAVLELLVDLHCGVKIPIPFKLFHDLSLGLSRVLLDEQ